MATTYNAFLEASGSENSDNDQGYDSEAAEKSKGHRSIYTSERAPKRRRLSAVESASDADDEVPTINDVAPVTTTQYPPSTTATDVGISTSDQPSDTRTTSHNITANSHKPIATGRPKEKPPKKKTPGVIYLSSLPPYLRPSALRNLLIQRGFGPITRLFLAPASKPTRGSKTKSTSTKSSKRQLYSEGWIEFASKSTAKRCAETLNAAPVGGKKGGFYRDDVWNMKYLRGMGWDELMAGVREETREEEGRRDEERLILARETKRFVQGVERGRRMKGIEGTRAKRKKDTEDDGEGPEADEAREIKRTWRQFEVKGRRTRGNPDMSADVRDEHVSDDVKRILGKIF
jgi:ESF2/ABP1 family protein